MEKEDWEMETVTLEEKKINLAYSQWLGGTGDRPLQGMRPIMDMDFPAALPQSPLSRLLCPGEGSVGVQVSSDHPLGKSLAFVLKCIFLFRAKSRVNYHRVILIL